MKQAPVVVGALAVVAVGLVMGIWLLAGGGRDGSPFGGGGVESGTEGVAGSVSPGGDAGDGAFVAEVDPGEAGEEEGRSGEGGGASVGDGPGAAGGGMEGGQAAAGRGPVVPTNAQPFVDPETGMPLLTVTGRVLTPDGEPVGGATVEAWEFGGSVAASDTSAVDGVYTLRMVRRGSFLLRARDPLPGGLVSPVSSPLFPNRPVMSGMDIVLVEPVTVRGRVLDRRQQPIAGATVRATDAIRTVLAPEALTGEDGRYELAGLPKTDGSGRSAIVTLMASHPEYTTDRTGMLLTEDEERDFVLTRAHSLKLEVTWADDGSPVTLFSYRLLRKGPSGLDVDEGISSQRVDAPDGWAMVNKVPPGEWRAEVVVLDPDGLPTSVRGSAEFRMEETREGVKVVPVAVDTGVLLAGRVVDRATGEPVAGAEVRFIEPNSGFGNFPRPGEGGTFSLPVTTTEADGSYSFEGLVEGRHYLYAEKGHRMTLEAVTVDLPVEGDRLDLEIELAGAVYGTVTGPEGDPVEGAQVRLALQRPTGDGWSTESETTDAKGEYRFDPVPVGAHYFTAFAGGEPFSRMIDLGPGEQFRQDVEFARRVTLSGRVTVGGRPPGREVTELSFGREGDTIRKAAPVDGSGRYTVELEPDVYVVSIAGGMLDAGGQLEPFTVADSPDRQTHDIDIAAGSARLRFLYPPDTEPQELNLVTVPEVMSMRYAFGRRRVYTEEEVVGPYLAGRYEFTVESTDGQWHGSSGWVEVGREPMTEVDIEVERLASRILIGRWAAGEIPNTEPIPVRYDVTPYLNAPATLDVLLNYESGIHALEATRARLLVNGAIESEESERAWSGADASNVIYTLTLRRLPPNARVEVELMMRTDGGMNSNGSVYMTIR